MILSVIGVTVLVLLLIGFIVRQRQEINHLNETIAVLEEATSHCLDIMEDLDVPEYMMETYGNAMMNYRHLIQ